MITFFTIPKPLGIPEIDRIQNQAIATWSNLPVEKEVLLFREEDVALSSKGTPVISDVFRRASEKAHYDILVYVNADIMFTFDLVAAISVVVPKMDRFLMSGQRTDVSDVSLNFQDRNWDETLRKIARQRGKLHPPHGIDWFAFRRSLVRELEMPPFVVGRIAWDNWMVARALELKVPVINATQHVLAVHQEHSFAHIHGGRKETRHGFEATQNLAMAGTKLADLSQASHQLGDLL